VGGQYTSAISLVMYDEYLKRAAADTRLPNRRRSNHTRITNRELLMMWPLPTRYAHAHAYLRRLAEAHHFRVLLE
jgi:hypothetical protein